MDDVCLTAQPEKAMPLTSWQKVAQAVFYPFAGLICGAFHAVRSMSLMAPSVANPYFEGGGLAGYSRSHILSLITAAEARDLLPPWAVIRASANKKQREDDALVCMKKNKLSFPLVARPDTETGPAGVALLKNDMDLRAYALAFPKGERFIVQEASKPECIAHLYYERRPDDNVGRIASLAFSYFPAVTGDGVRTVRDLMLDHPVWSQDAATYMADCAASWNLILGRGESMRISMGSDAIRHGITEDARDRITPALEAHWDKIFRALPEFYVGAVALGIQCKEDLETGHNVTLLNIEGPSLYPHIRDGGVPVLEALRIINASVRAAYDIGSINKKRGHKPDNFLYVLGMWLKQMALRKQYPVSSY